MTTRILLLGNMVATALTVVGLLQLLSWPIAGVLILTTLVLTTLISRSPSLQTSTVPALPRKTAPTHPTTTDSGGHAVHTTEKTTTHSHTGSPRIEQRVKPAAEHVKTTIASVSLSRSKLEHSRTVASQEDFKSAPPSFGLPTPSQVGLTTPKPEPDMSPTVVTGDYISYDIELERGKQVDATVTSTGRVNVYILDRDNLNSLDLGEEFWSEAGEENVQTATLRFAAPEKGRWFLVVENVDAKDVSAQVEIQKGPSHAT